MWFFALKVNVCFGQEIFFAFSAGFFVLFAAGSLVRRVRRDPMEVPMSNEKSGLPWFIYTYVMLTLDIYIYIPMIFIQSNMDVYIMVLR